MRDHNQKQAMHACMLSFIFPAEGRFPSLLAVGDIAPREGIPKAEKRRLEAVRLILPSFPALKPPATPTLTSHLASSGSHAKLCARDVA